MDSSAPRLDSPLTAESSRLRALHDITLELSRALDVGSLCKSAVKLCSERLGFDRVSIWFIDPSDPGYLVGTWGTDEEGRPRDESGVRTVRDRNSPDEALYAGRIRYLVDADVELYDDRHNVVGRSDRAAAPLWDGERIVGALLADSYFSHRAMTPDDGEILALLARSVAHLCFLKRSEAALKEALEAKAVLLSELRHRTKNSFNLISSLLSLETLRMKDPSLAETLRKLGDRVAVLTSIYGRLDVAGGLERIDLASFLGKIAADLLDGYGADRRGIRLEADLVALEARMERAVPLGLIVNELVTDSLRHAFPEGRKGTIFLALREEGEGRALLRVADDGVGMQPGSQALPSAGLGLTLVNALCDQIGAGLSVGAREGPGMAFDLRFPA